VSSPKLIGADEAAAILGVSRETLRQGICKGRFPRPEVMSSRRGAPNLWRRSTIESLAMRRRGLAPPDTLTRWNSLIRRKRMPAGPRWGEYPERWL